MSDLFGGKIQGDPDRMHCCRACGREISKRARSCPHCGEPYTTLGSILFAMLLGLILAGILLRR
jgi:hypothetical protein